jgi:predicted dehydrogenase
MKPNQPTRREFLKLSAATATATALTGATALPGYAAEDNTIKIALVGCGGRGTGAVANALSTQGPTKLWAVADAFPHRLETSLKSLTAQFEAKMDVPPERQFLGLDGYKKAIDALGRGGLVILATPPGFRSLHLEYAVQQGVNVFMEKSFAVDGPGVRRVIKAGELARQKNLKIAGGLMWRHDLAREEAIKRLHDSEIGDLITLRTYRMHGAVGYSPKPPGKSEVAHQISNYNNFTWCNAGFFVDWLIHNIDVCCWAKNDWPINAQGHGGRASRTEPDQMFDHYAVEYTFPDGTKLFAQARHINKCYDIFSDLAHGAKGSAVIMENLSAPKSRIYKNHVQIPANETWRYKGPTPDPYQREHDLLFAAIRQDQPYNEADHCAKAVMTAILGRMAAYSGQLVTYEQALNSDLELAPGLENLTLDGPAPVMPDAQGRYPVPIPGQTRAF